MIWLSDCLFGPKKALFLLLLFFAACQKAPRTPAGRFPDVAPQLGVAFRYGKPAPKEAFPQSSVGGGVVILDVNRDGRLDIFVTGFEADNALFMQQPDGTFKDEARQMGIAGNRLSRGATAGDLDNDGFEEIVVATWEGVQVYHNDQGKRFSVLSTWLPDQPEGLKFAVSVALGDYDRDGLLDLLVGSHVNPKINLMVYDKTTKQPIGYNPRCFGIRLYRNIGGHTFTEVGAHLGLHGKDCTWVASFSDYDNDGDLDILVINDFGYDVVPNRLYRNDGPTEEGWRFTEVSRNTRFDVPMFGMGLAIGDYNRDGLLDYYMTNIGRNVLLQGQKDGTFLDVTEDAGVDNTFVSCPEFGECLRGFGWGTLFSDYDNDGFQDLLMCAGYLQGINENDKPIYRSDTRQPNRLFRNTGFGYFLDEAARLGLSDPQGSARGCAAGDLDNDGDEDFYIVNSTGGTARLFRNNVGNRQNWIKLRLEGTKSNRSAIGARVEATVGKGLLVREVSGGSSLHSRSSLEVLFGLGKASKAERVVIRWPSGLLQEIGTVEAGRSLYIKEGESRF